jgi:cytoskeletal protein CcmA (bactofilin family)
MFKRESRPAPDQIEVIIGPRATFSGDLRCDASIRLDGTVEGGVIETPGNVLITESGRIMCDIKARTVSIAGAYKGSIKAERVELLEGGRLWGTINVRSFLLDEGAHFQGELIMQDELQDEQPEEPLLVPRPPTGEQIPVEDLSAKGTGEAEQPSENLAK